jgi:hypothetical protein
MIKLSLGQRIHERLDEASDELSNTTPAGQSKISFAKWIRILGSALHSEQL